MAVNRGVSPIDPTTEVGKFRLAIGDTESVPLDPPETGFENYKMFSDDEIEAFISVGESFNSAMVLAYLQLAGAAALESRTVKDFDLSVDLTKRATDLRLLAQFWQSKADAESAEVFELFDGGNGCGCHPEAAPWVVCRREGCRGNFLF